CDIRPRAQRDCEKKVAHYTEGMACSAFGRHVLLNAIGKEQQPDAIVIRRRCKSENAADLGGNLPFGSLGGSEIAPAGEICHKNDGLFPLLYMLFDIERAGSRRYVPIYQPHIVARSVGAHLVELHSATAKDASIFARKTRIDQFAAMDLEEFNLARQIARQYDFGHILTTKITKNVVMEPERDRECA